MKSNEEIKKLIDQELLYLEHDTEVNLLGLLPGDGCSIKFYLEFNEYHKNLVSEIETRGLTKIKRLNGFD